MLSRFLEQLSKDLSLEQPLAPNAEGFYSLLLASDLQISFVEKEDSSITLCASLAPLPEKNSEEFLLRAMSANLLGRETGRGVLGLDQEGKQILLVRALSGQESYREFHECVEEFANYADAWRQEVVEFGKPISD